MNKIIYALIHWEMILYAHTGAHTNTHTHVKYADATRAHAHAGEYHKNI